MKKFIIVILLALSLLSIAPIVKGEIVSEPISVEQELRMQLIDLIKQLIISLQEQLLVMQQQSTLQQQIILQNEQIINKPEVVVKEPIPAVIPPENKTYDSFLSTISPSVVPFDGSKAKITIKILNTDKNGLSGKEVTFGLYKCRCSDQSVQTSRGYFWTMVSDENGEISFDVTVTGKMNNFLNVQVTGEPMKWVTIPTSFENQIWNWDESNGGYFTKI